MCVYRRRGLAHYYTLLVSRYSMRVSAISTSGSSGSIAERLIRCGVNVSRGGRNPGLSRPARCGRCHNVVERRGKGLEREFEGERHSRGLSC